MDQPTPAAQTAEYGRGPERNQCLRCGGHISWSRWFCNVCAEKEGLTYANGLAPSKPKRTALIDGDVSA